MGAGGHEGLRSIPACTGEPEAVFRFFPRFTVYPRVHGGTKCAPKHICDNCGLSPRARGNPLEHLKAVDERRSIPACTGEPATPTR